MYQVYQKVYQKTPISSVICVAHPPMRRRPRQLLGARGLKCGASPEPEEVHHKALDFLVAITLPMMGPGKLLFKRTDCFVSA